MSVYVCMCVCVCVCARVCVCVCMIRIHVYTHTWLHQLTASPSLLSAAKYLMVGNPVMSYLQHSVS